MTASSHHTAPHRRNGVWTRGDSEEFLFFLRKRKVIRSQKKNEGVLFHNTPFLGIEERNPRWTRGDSNPQPPACEAGALPLRYLPNLFGERTFCKKAHQKKLFRKVSSNWLFANLFLKGRKVDQKRVRAPSEFGTRALLVTI